MPKLGSSLLALLAVGAAVACAGPSAKRSHAGPELLKLTATPGLVVRRACTPTGPEQCFDARDDNCNGIIDEGCGINTGLLQFAIAWDKPQADVDLDVTDPNGELVEVGRVTRSGLVKERDCPGRSNDCKNQNLENVYLEEGEALRGRYRIDVRLEKLGPENPPILVTFGARVGPKTYALEFELHVAEDARELTIEL